MSQFLKDCLMCCFVLVFSEDLGAMFCPILSIAPISMQGRTTTTGHGVRRKRWKAFREADWKPFRSYIKGKYFAGREFHSLAVRVKKVL